MTGPGTGPARGSGNACLACGGPLEPIGVEQFRMGGTSGGIKLLIGEWGELGERMLPLEMWFCGACRRVEFRLP